MLKTSLKCTNFQFSQLSKSDNSHSLPTPRLFSAYVQIIRTPKYFFLEKFQIKSLTTLTPCILQQIFKGEVRRIFFLGSKFLSASN